MVMEAPGREECLTASVWPDSAWVKAMGAEPGEYAPWVSIGLLSTGDMAWLSKQVHG